MGITKQYLRVEASAVFGLVASQRANVVYLHAVGDKAHQVAVGACENVIIWDLHTKEKVKTLQGDKHEVSSLARSPDHAYLAVGYMNGSIKTFDLTTGESLVTFHGHRSTVTALEYEHGGLRLVSGAKDTDVILWDIVSESGLFRLKGHKGEITKVHFITGKNMLITSSKDTFIKFWDLETQHCFRTLVGHRSEVYSFALINGGKRLISGCADSELRVWDITYKDEINEQDDKDTDPLVKRQRTEDVSDQEDEDLQLLQCHPRGSVMRQGRDRVICLVTDPSERYLLCHGPGSYCELFVLSTMAELKKKIAKRRKKARLQASKEDGDSTAPEPTLALEDEIRYADRFKLSAKLRWLDVGLMMQKQMKVVALLNNNSLETVLLKSVDGRTLEVAHKSSVCANGHRTDVRTLSFSSDNTTILSASAEQLKLWSRSTLHCIRTLDCDYALCSVFAPGDRNVIIGTKTGKLQVFDIDQGSMVASVDAHSAALWSLSMAPDKRGIVTGSADHTAKFWNFELMTSHEDPSGRKHLTLLHCRTLQLDDDVLCVKFSPDQRLLAVSLLDNTVKIFFVDTLKFFLSLYGHKLPVLCLDISSDSTLIATGSADRNVKIWGLDFGDCHRSLFAHDDSIMCLQFVPKTHMFYTGSKDHKIKQWDADNFENVLTLQGHHGEVWSLAVSSSGNFLVSAGHDRSLRLWEKTEEILVLEEEREMEREKEFEESVAQSGEPVVAGETTTEVGFAGKKSIETIKAVERLMEAVEVYGDESKRIALHTAQCQAAGKEVSMLVPHPLMVAYNATTPAQFVLEVLKKIRSSELEESLLLMPFSLATQLLSILEVLLSNGWETELSCRCILFLLRIHHGQITSTQILLPTIDRLRALATERVNQLKDMVGFNLMGLQFLKMKIEEKQEVKLFADATAKFREKKKKKVILTMAS